LLLAVVVCRCFLLRRWFGPSGPMCFCSAEYVQRV
jgi:hypothetical protein